MDLFIIFGISLVSSYIFTRVQYFLKGIDYYQIYTQDIDIEVSILFLSILFFIFVFIVLSVVNILRKK